MAPYAFLLVPVLFTLLMIMILSVTVMKRKTLLSDDRAAMRKLAEDSKKSPEETAHTTRLLDMSKDQLLDAQRRFITDNRAPHIVEIIANLTPYAVDKYTIRKGGSDLLLPVVKSGFMVDLKGALAEVLPLGGSVVSLPHNMSGGVTLHALVSLETRDKVDAHELAEHVCSEVRRINFRNFSHQCIYSRLTFIPVSIVDRKDSDPPFPAGRKPGLWSSTARSEVDRKYTQVFRRASGSATEEPTSEPSAETDTEWEDARTLLRTVTDEFAAFEFSPMDVAFTRRLLWDLTEPATAKFYEAFDAANMLLTDKPPADPSGFVEAVRVASAAWKAADRNARDKAEQNIYGGNQVLDADRIKHRDTAKAAMTLALSPATTDSEAGVAWSRSMDALSKAGLTVPPSKIKKLEGNELVQRATRALTS